MREDAETFNALNEIGAILTDGHFQYKFGGRHGSTYINHHAIFQNPKVARMLSLKLAQRFQKSSVDGVIGARNGGASLAERVAEHLGFLCGRNVIPLAAEKSCERCEGAGFYLTEDTIEHIRGKRFLAVDGVGHSGRVVKVLISLVKSAGGTVVAVGFVCVRGSLKREDFGDINSYETLLDFPLESWDPAKGECQPCIDKIPLNTRFGHAGDPKQYFLPLSGKK